MQGVASFNNLSTYYDEVKQFATEINLASPDKNERFNFNSNFSISDEIYIDGRCSFDDISLNRFSTSQSKNDTLTANITFLGTLENLLLQANLDNLSMHINKNPLVASGIFLLDDGIIKVPNATINWNNHKLSSFELNFLPSNGIADLSFNYDGEFSGKKTKANVNLNMVGQNQDESKNINVLDKMTSFIQAFNLNIDIKDVNFGSTVLKAPLTASVIRNDDVIAFYGGKNDEIYGFYMNDGNVSFQMSDSLKSHFSFDGIISSDKLDLSCYNIKIDVPQVMNLLPIDRFVSFKSSNINGKLKIKGSLQTPEFYGDLHLSNLAVNSPDFAPDLVYATDIPIRFNETVLTVPYTILKSKDFSLWATCTSEFDGWIPYETIVKCGTIGENLGHMKTKNIIFHADGGVLCDIVMTIYPNAFDIRGYTKFDKGNFSIPFANYDKLELVGDGYKFSMDLDLDLGNRAEFRWPNMELPLLRTFAPTKEKINFLVDPDKNLFAITGLATIRGGELMYIKRNFYIKDGNITFLSNAGQINPLITLNAEIRDRDAEGNQIKLILSLKDQPLIGSSDEWISKITSTPPLSDAEVMSILTKVSIGDINKDTAWKDTLTKSL